MFTMRYPIPKRFMWNGKIIQVNQWFGERESVYGPGGHSGVDFKTRNPNAKYVRYKDGWKNHPTGRTYQEKNGRIHILACHDGTIKTILHDDKQGKGWGIFVIAEPDGDVQHRTLYWHIETPWRSIKTFRGFVLLIMHLMRIYDGRKVRKGAVVAIAGNNGFSSGPHLHLALDRRKRVNGVWGPWKRINPMFNFRDKDVIAQKLVGPSLRQWVYEGEDVTEEQAQEILKTLPKLYS